MRRLRLNSTDVYRLRRLAAIYVLLTFPSEANPEYALAILTMRVKYA
jgi:hypothetical protein